MNSGAKCHSSCLVAYNELKMMKKHRYILFHIDEGEVRILKEAERAATYQDFRDDMIDAMKSEQGRTVFYYVDPEKLKPLEKYGVCVLKVCCKVSVPRDQIFLGST
ncbi:unnamed protein product [Schistosoma margrebowiei]|uniref:C2H2-type domain-containing protein n=1 Tax=Schistosoma margrebowiei TaxID=48269 RepID=A0AA84ZG48_9TREM|nr:unnamed protein product [Schistosoma margrebowiei]